MDLAVLRADRVTSAFVFTKRSCIPMALIVLDAEEVSAMVLVWGGGVGLCIDARPSGLETTVRRYGAKITLRPKGFQGSSASPRAI